MSLTLLTNEERCSDITVAIRSASWASPGYPAVMAGSHCCAPSVPPPPPPPAILKDQLQVVHTVLLALDRRRTGLDRTMEKTNKINKLF